MDDLKTFCNIACVCGVFFYMYPMPGYSTNQMPFTTDYLFPWLIETDRTCDYFLNTFRWFILNDSTVFSQKLWLLHLFVCSIHVNKSSYRHRHGYRKIPIYFSTNRQFIVKMYSHVKNIISCKMIMQYDNNRDLCYTFSIQLNNAITPSVSLIRICLYLLMVLFYLL